ncbi:hypothetical protein ACFUTV_12465 [Streptomyces sp. NPDC057298]|uniref:hypothetical protein n=1 Tax=Streptomyces sp. NPDC057298 TaxID=3346091 RepID=UPI0036347CFA
MDGTKAGRVERPEPDPPEVVPPQNTTASADKDESGGAGTRVLGEVVSQKSA